MKWSPLNAGKILDAQSGLIRCKPPRSKVCIVANGPSKRAAPLEDPEWEVWALNSICPRDSQRRIRADRWFELHPLSAQTKAEMQFLRELPVPVYMFDAYPEVPNAVRFPLEDICERFRIVEGGSGDFFSCTFCYQIALAITLGVETIALCGVDLDLGSARERTVERMGVLWWVARAMGAGINVQVPESCKLFIHPWRYGYDYEAERDGVEAMMEDLSVLAAPWDDPAEVKP